jgi:hypothetical protein
LVSAFDAISAGGPGGLQLAALNIAGLSARHHAGGPDRGQPLAVVAWKGPESSGADQQNTRRNQATPWRIDLTKARLRRFKVVLQEFETYVSSESTSIINYTTRRRSAEPIATATTERVIDRPLQRMIAKQ